MDSAASGALVGIFADAIQIANEVAAAATPGIDGAKVAAIGLSVARRLLDFHDRLENVPSIPDVPPDVLSMLKALARIVRGTQTECIGYGDVALYLAKSNMHSVAEEGWKAILRSNAQDNRLMAWADDAATASAEEESSNSGIDAIGEDEQMAEGHGQTDNQEAMRRLLTLFTGGVMDEGLRQAAAIVCDDKLNVNEKLTKLDSVLGIPANASAEKLGALLGVSATAVKKTDWWKKYRHGKKPEEIDSRRRRLVSKGSQIEKGAPDDDG